MFRKIFNGLWEYRLYLLLFILLICFTLIASFNGLYGQDSYEYLRYTNSLLDFVKHGTNPGKFYWPLLYPISGVIFSVLFKTLFALQFVSVVSFVLSGIYLEKILKAIYKEVPGIVRSFVFLFFLFSPYLLRASLTIMSDSLCLFLITAAAYYFIKYKEQKQNAFFIWFVIFTTAAICTRYAAFVILIIPAVFAAYYFLKRFNIKTLLLSLIAIALVILPHFLIYQDYPIDFLKNSWFQSWSFTNFFRSTFNAADGDKVYTFPNTIFCFFNLVHPAYCFLGILFVSVSIKSFVNRGITVIQWIFISSVLLYALFLAGIPFQDLRHLILTFPFILIIFFSGFIEAKNFLNNKKPAMLVPIIVGVCFIIQIGFFVRVFIPFYHYNRIEKEISTEVVKYNPATLYTFSIDGAVSQYGFTGQIVNMYKVKLDTLPSVQKNAMVLFNEKLFSDTWKNKNPMLNWEYLKTKDSLVKMEDLPDNWELYSIKFR